MSAKTQKSPESSPAPDEVDDKPWQFKKGQSGNPGGRPKGLARTIRETVPAAQLVRHFQAIFNLDPVELAALNIDPEAVTVNDRSKAGDWLADRGYGKAPLYAPVEGGDPLELGDLDRAVAAAVDELAGPREAKAASGTPEQALGATGTG